MANGTNPPGKLVCNAVDVVNGKLEFVEAAIPLQGGVVSLGKSITKAAADHMITGYVNEVKARFNNDASLYGDQVIAVQFGKETILHILSQFKCESLMFYLCKNVEGHHSIAIIPLDSNDGELTRPATIGSDANAKIAGSEVGGRRTISQFESVNMQLTPGNLKLLF